MPSRSIHSVADEDVLFTAESYSTVCTHHISFVHSPIGGYLGCFCVLAIVGNSAVSMGCTSCLDFSLILLYVHFPSEDFVAVIYRLVVLLAVEPGFESVQLGSGAPDPQGFRLQGCCFWARISQTFLVIKMFFSCWFLS